MGKRIVIERTTNVKRENGQETGEVEGCIGCLMIVGIIATLLFFLG